MKTFDAEVKCTRNLWENSLWEIMKIMYHTSIVHLRPIHTSPALAPVTLARRLHPHPSTAPEPVDRGTAPAPALVENQNHIDLENSLVINHAGAGDGRGRRRSMNWS